jgi:hypothetical protein
LFHLTTVTQLDHAQLRRTYPKLVCGERLSIPMVSYCEVKDLLSKQSKTVGIAILFVSMVNETKMLPEGAMSIDIENNVRVSFNLWKWRHRHYCSTADLISHCLLPFSHVIPRLSSPFFHMMSASSQPLIPEKYLDAPSQRLYCLSLGLLCQVRIRVT